MPLLELLLLVGRTSPALTQKMVVEMGLPAEYFKEKVLSPIHFCSIGQCLLSWDPLFLYNISSNQQH